MKKSTKIVVLAILVAGVAGVGIWKTVLVFTQRTGASSFQPPPDSAIPAGKFGDVVRFGEQIFRDPATYARPFVGNQLRCSNCHLEAGRQGGASPAVLPWLYFSSVLEASLNQISATMARPRRWCSGGYRGLPPHGTPL